MAIKHDDNADNAVGNVTVKLPSFEPFVVFACLWARGVHATRGLRVRAVLAPRGESAVLAPVLTWGTCQGSNAVNVFLGLGMPWLAATIYWNGVFPSGWTKEKPWLPGTERNVCTNMGELVGNDW